MGGFGPTVMNGASAPAQPGPPQQYSGASGPRVVGRPNVGGGAPVGGGMPGVPALGGIGGGGYGGVPIRGIGGAPSPAAGGVPQATTGNFNNSVASANPAFTQINQAIQQRAQATAAQANAPNPAVSQATQAINARAGQLAGQENTTNPYLLQSIANLNQRLSTDPSQQAQNFAAQNIRSSADAAQQNLSDDLARRGIMPGSGIAAQLSAQIGNQASQALGQSATQIGLGRQSAMDQLVLGGQGIMSAPAQYQLGQEGVTNQAYGMIPSLASTAANYSLGAGGLANSALGLGLTGANDVAGNQLAQQGLGLQQYQAENAATNMQNQNAISQMMALNAMRNQNMYAPNMSTGGF